LLVSELGFLFQLAFGSPQTLEPRAGATELRRQLVAALVLAVLGVASVGRAGAFLEALARSGGRSDRGRAPSRGVRELDAPLMENDAAHPGQPRDGAGVLAARAAEDQQGVLPHVVPRETDTSRIAAAMARLPTSRNAAPISVGESG
jgi:hypothetical protein